MTRPEGKHDPVRQSVVVDCPIEDAFRLFTERFGDWWPLGSYSITGHEAETCNIEPWIGGRVYERTHSNGEHDWGTVIEWNPPEHVKFNWNPGGVSDRAESVEVEFSVEAVGTRVTLIHTGWEKSGVAVCALPMDSAAMWPAVLNNFFLAFAAEEMLATL